MTNDFSSITSTTQQGGHRHRLTKPMSGFMIRVSMLLRSEYNRMYD